MDARLPHEYPRRLLVCVAGIVPQIITETLYALAVVRDPPFLPTALRLLTTAAGQRETELQLLQGTAHFDALCADYAIPRPHFGSDCIHVLGALHGEPREDIRTPEDNRIAADEITRLFRHWAQDPDCAIHASIAGGRKTMGYYLGYAASLFGRRQDRLSHVLVNEPFEQHPEFFYPPRQPVVLRARRDGLSHSTAEARVQVAEIPFIRLGSGMPQNLLDGDAGFAETIAAAERHLGPPLLTIDLDEQRLSCGQQPVKLGRRAFLVYAWFARRRQTLGDRAALAAAEITGDTAARAELLHLLGSRGKLSYEAEAAEHLRDAGTDAAAWLHVQVSRINKKLLECLGPVGAAQYGIASTGTARGPRCLLLPPAQIVFGPLPAEDTP